MSNMSIRQRPDPSEATLKELETIDRLLPSIRLQVQKRKVAALAGKAVWGDQADMAKVRSDLQNIAIFLGIGT